MMNQYSKLASKFMQLSYKARNLLPNQSFKLLEVKRILETRAFFCVEKNDGDQTWIRKKNVRCIDQKGDTMKLVMPYQQYKEWFN